MSELIKAMRNSPQNVRYADACRVADAFFGKARQSGTSHRIWKMPWAGDPRVNLQEGEGGKAKAYQVHQLLKALDQLTAVPARKQPQSDQNEGRSDDRQQKNQKRRPRKKR